MTLAAKPSSATGRKRHGRRSLFSLLVFGVCLSGCASNPSVPAMSDTPAAAEFTFKRYDFITDYAKHQTILSGFFRGGAMAELAVVNIDENDDRRLRIYTLGGDTWMPRLDARLRPEVLFIDVAKSGERDRLITYEHGRLNEFDAESGTERALVAVTYTFKAPIGGEIPRVDITRDVNGDGRDDLVLPETDGFRVFIQMRDGEFADPVKLGPPEPHLAEVAYGDTRSYGEVGLTAQTIPWYQTRVHQMDYNRDGHSDLAFWNEDHFDVYHQDEHGRFDPVVKAFTTDVTFDSDGAYSLIFGVSEKTKQKVLHSLSDLNGDGVADLVTLSLVGRSLFNKRSRYEVHFGTPTPDGTMFARDVNTAIQSNRIQAGMQPHDFDRDGQVDIMFTLVKLGIGKIIWGLLTDSFSLDLEFYRMEDGVYPDKPNATRKITADFDPLDKREDAFFPSVLIGDVNGDQRSDLLVGKDREELHVFLGVPGPNLFARQPQKVAIAMPADEEDTWLVDLNRDGKQDLLMHHPSAAGLHRMTMLIAR